ncbi:hypothetical protein OH828_14570 [Streptomyces anulatus]|uniref:hypothetical protein n=1 Tax=Streptomyces anulatus TaxID=1892 RepID=UPI00386E31B9
MATKPRDPRTAAITRTRHVLTGGRWFLIVGLVFYSLMTTTPFVSAHSEWAWSGFVLGLIVDAAFIMALSAESTLARHGVTKLGRWPAAFRWLTGLSTVFLNVWLSVERRDWVGVAVHLIAPVLVMLLAEVGPVYMAALADAERDALKAPEAPFVGPVTFTPLQSLAAPETAPNVFGGHVPARVMHAPENPDQTALFEPAADDVETGPHDELVNEPVDEPKRLSKAEAAEIIEKGWRHKLSVQEVAKAATRHPATVTRQFAKLDALAKV